MTNSSKNKTEMRNSDPEEFHMTPEQFASIVRNGGKGSKPPFDWASWLKLGIAALLPFITLVVFISNLDGNVRQNKISIDNNSLKIQEYETRVMMLEKALHVIDNRQGVILEKVTRSQEDIEKLVTKLEEIDYSNE